MAQTRKPRQKSGVITLKVVAQHVGLTPGTVSAVLNDAPSARSIPQETKNRIHAAAKELDYRPNFFARTLRSKRTNTIGVIAEEIGDSYGSLVISGIEEYLAAKRLFLSYGCPPPQSGAAESLHPTIVAAGSGGFHHGGFAVDRGARCCPRWPFPDTSVCRASPTSCWIIIMPRGSR